MDDVANDVRPCDQPRPASGHPLHPANARLLSRIPFIKSPADAQTQQNVNQTRKSTPTADSSPPMSAATQQHKTRRRRGSLRKAALLGRGAQRERRDSKPLMIDTLHANAFEEGTTTSSSSMTAEHNALGLKVSDFAPRALPKNQSTPSSSNQSVRLLEKIVPPPSQIEPETIRQDSYNSTTDEEDVLQMHTNERLAAPNISASPGSDSYFASCAAGSRPRSFQQAKSPLSYSSSTNLPASNTAWDYSETEWWGWVVLTVTWFVFVVGMGSCLNVWSWAWDVGTTPYAPPELEDDPTLPIVGYYPALMILTGVMAWVWVVVAWVGMKYFRHAKISGD
ncbi:uncharacterized protein UV8b_03202 [Ustilaginoidea virens]|uniref:Uncharacterized protein n=1 Tax=Ustilaginoidea virens TaxID=1159556 RepID=A0A063BQQ5_USTVR|nr:uncharacterized protein UV8b_03202 [Ustilaginoidea virens]QUC18961.1 hypothetical protein UV8b_03202 [Ustilaginoidea virens]GAO19878.1 hypothetical protein UVI_02030440 [Ustilaginoidea virens]